MTEAPSAPRTRCCSGLEDRAFIGGSLRRPHRAEDDSPVVLGIGSSNGDFTLRELVTKRAGRGSRSTTGQCGSSRRPKRSATKKTLIAASRIEPRLSKQDKPLLPRLVDEICTKTNLVSTLPWLLERADQRRKLTSTRRSSPTLHPGDVILENFSSHRAKLCADPSDSRRRAVLPAEYFPI